MAAMRAGGALILLAALMVSVDVILRWLFGLSIAGLDEVSGYLFAIATAASFSATLVRRQNVRIEGLYRLMPFVLRVVLDFFAVGALIAFIGLIVYIASDLVMYSFTNWSHSISPLQTPLFIPQIIWISLLVMAVASGLCVVAVATVALFERDWPALQRLIGPLSLDEEIEGELGDIVALGVDGEKKDN